MPPTTSYLHHFHALLHAVPQWALGAAGADNALRWAAQALQQPDLRGTALRLLHSAWELQPLDAQLARLVHAGMAHGELTGAAPQSCLATGLAHWCAEPDSADAKGAEADGAFAAAEEMPPHAATAFWTAHVRGERGGYALGRALRYCVARPDAAELWREVLATALPDGCDASWSGVRVEADLCALLRRRLELEWLCLHAPAHEALAALDAAVGLFVPAVTGKNPALTANSADNSGENSAAGTDLLHGTPFAYWYALRRATALTALGAYDEARAPLAAVWRANPYHPNILLALHELGPAPHFPLGGTQGAADTLPPLALYSWNNATLLRRTLDSLTGTEAVDAPLLLLNNGSSDDTAAVLRSAHERWRGPVQVMELPVNVGAPAARNWILAQETVQRAEAVLFLDDDVEAAPGWLHSMAGVMAAHPEAAVLGCAIADMPAPHAMQSGEFFLLPEQTRSFVDVQEHIFIHGGMGGCTEPLLTRYTRPCVSVSGCCHWLRLDAAHGGAVPFDVCFNPSQFDDFARDLRLGSMGQRVLYTGLAGVRHVQRSSLKQAVTRAKNAHIFGNKLKLEYMFSAQECDAVRERALRTACADLLDKARALAAKEAV